MSLIWQKNPVVIKCERLLVIKKNNITYFFFHLRLVLHARNRKFCSEERTFMNYTMPLNHGCNNNNINNKTNNNIKKKKTNKNALPQMLKFLRSSPV